MCTEEYCPISHKVIGKRWFTCLPTSIYYQYTPPSPIWPLSGRPLAQFFLYPKLYYVLLIINKTTWWNFTKLLIKCDPFHEVFFYKFFTQKYLVSGVLQNSCSLGFPKSREKTLLIELFFSKDCNITQK